MAQIPEGTIPAGWTQADHDAYWTGWHSGDAHARFVEGYGETDDTEAPPFTGPNASRLLMLWSDGYESGKDEYEPLT